MMRMCAPWPSGSAGATSLASTDRFDLPAIVASADPALADDAQSEGLEAHVARRRRIGEKDHVGDAQSAQDLRADADLDEPTFAHAPLAGGLALSVLRHPGRYGLRPQVADQ